MPIHDWTRVRSNLWHDFHQHWTVVLSHRLNSGLLPAGYYSLLESKTRHQEPVCLTVDMSPSLDVMTGAAAVTLLPPKARYVARFQNDRYALKANRVAVHHPDGKVVAVIEVVSPGNKDGRDSISKFVRKAVSYLNAGVKLLIVDLYPPSRRDPQGIHKAIWDRLCDEPFALPKDKPLTLVSYAVGNETVAYVEPVAVGDVLPDMPVFLDADYYVPCPLEATYMAAWEQFPAVLKGPLESPPP